MTSGPQAARPRRRGWLKNRNPAGDLDNAKPCGARTRKGTPCKGPAMPNGRCRMHGGPSTGPRTPEGKARASRWKHGRYSRATIDARRQARAIVRVMRELLGGRP